MAHGTELVPGIELVLVIGTPIPKYLTELGSPRVCHSNENFMGRRVQTLRIADPEAEAVFTKDGMVALKAFNLVDLPFREKTVFEIRHLPIGTSENIRNRELCSQCVEFSGEAKPLPRKPGYVMVTCSACHEHWEYP